MSEWGCRFVRNRFERLQAEQAAAVGKNPSGIGGNVLGDGYLIGSPVAVGNFDNVQELGPILKTFLLFRGGTGPSGTVQLDVGRFQRFGEGDQVAIPVGCTMRLTEP